MGFWKDFFATVKSERSSSEFTGDFLVGNYTRTPAPGLTVQNLQHGLTWMDAISLGPHSPPSLIQSMMLKVHEQTGDRVRCVDENERVVDYLTT